MVRKSTRVSAKAASPEREKPRRTRRTKRGKRSDSTSSSDSFEEYSAKPTRSRGRRSAMSDDSATVPHAVDTESGDVADDSNSSKPNKSPERSRRTRFTRGEKQTIVESAETSARPENDGADNAHDSSGNFAHDGSAPCNIEEDSKVGEGKDDGGKGKSKGKHKSKIENSSLQNDSESQSQSEISENVQVTPVSPTRNDIPIDNDEPVSTSGETDVQSVPQNNTDTDGNVNFDDDRCNQSKGRSDETESMSVERADSRDEAENVHHVETKINNNTKAGNVSHDDAENVHRIDTVNDSENNHRDKTDSNIEQIDRNIENMHRDDSEKIDEKHERPDDVNLEHSDEFKHDPDKTKQDPDKSKQDPDKTRQDPDNTKQDPDKTKQDPDKIKQHPDKPKQDPDKIKQDPDKTKHDPDETKHDPDEIKRDADETKHDHRETETTQHDDEENEQGDDRKSIRRDDSKNTHRDDTESTRDETKSPHSDDIRKVLSDNTENVRHVDTKNNHHDKDRSNYSNTNSPIDNDCSATVQEEVGKKESRKIKVKKTSENDNGFDHQTMIELKNGNKTSEHEATKKATSRQLADQSDDEDNSKTKDNVEENSSEHDNHSVSSTEPGEIPKEKLKLKRSISESGEKCDASDLNLSFRKWGESFEDVENLVKHFSIVRVNTDQLNQFCSKLEVLDQSDVKLEVIERISLKDSKKHDRKVSIEHISELERPSYDTQMSEKSFKSDDQNTDFEDNSNIIAMNRKISIVEDTASKLRPPPSPAKNPTSAVLYITNLVRPFTLKQLKEMLERTGKILEDGFWTDRIKSQCYVQYENVEEAESTRNAIHGVNWPIGNGKKLVIEFATPEDLEKARNPPPPPVVKAPSPVPEKIVVPEKENQEPHTKKPRRVSEVDTKERAEREKGRNETHHVREWDVGKDHPRKHRTRSRSPTRERDEKRRRRRTPSPRDDFISRKQKKQEETVPQKLMDDLFQKTKTMPSIFWQPLSPEEISMKQQQRLQRMAEHKRRMEETTQRTRADFGRAGPFRRRYD